MPGDTFKWSDEVQLFRPRATSAAQVVLVVTEWSVCSAAAARLDSLRQAFDRAVLAPLRTTRLRELVGRPDWVAVGAWIARRSRTHMPRSVELTGLALGDGQGDLRAVRLSTDATAAVEVSRARKVSRMLQSGARPEGVATRLITRLLEAELQGQFASGAYFTTKRDLQVARQMIEDKLECGEPAVLFTLLCPPYIKATDDGAMQGYIGLSNMYGAPMTTTGFRYDYAQYCAAMNAACALAASVGVRTQGVLVLGDWAIVEIEGVRSSLPTDEAITACLEAFLNGITRAVQASYPELKVTSFQQLGVSRVLPIGIPGGDDGRREWLRTHGAQTVSLAGNVSAEPLFDHALSCAGSDAELMRMLNWREVESAPLPAGIQRRDYVDLARVFQNILRIRVSDRRLPPTQGDLGSAAYAGLRRAAFLDAVVRWVTYGVYSGCVEAAFGPAICIYMDDGFTACGNLMRRTRVPVLFLDPQALLEMAPK